jgi:hypothetical protein
VSASAPPGPGWTSPQPGPGLRPVDRKPVGARVWIAVAAAVLGLGAAAGGALYFTGALEAPSRSRSSTKKKTSARSSGDEPSASPAAKAPATGGPLAWCPAVAIACAQMRVSDRRAVSLDELQAEAVALARKSRPDAELVRISGMGLTDAGLDLDSGGNVTFTMTRGIAVNAHDDHLTSMNTEELLPRPLPPCTLMTAHQRARVAGLPAKPSASFIFGEQVNFIVSGGDTFAVELDPATCQPKASP